MFLKQKPGKSITELCLNPVISRVTLIRSGVELPLTSRLTRITHIRHGIEPPLSYYSGISNDFKTKT